MKTITIRVEDDIFNKIEEHRGLKSKSEFYRKLIEDYLNKPEDSLNIHEDSLNNSEYVRNILKENESMKAELTHKQELLKMANDWINDMRNQVGFLQFEYQKISGRLALPDVRKWWEFWKK
ncbi:MAG: hypothetical protein WA102_08970 [Candidatus Methanoperedens sp.]